MRKFSNLFKLPNIFLTISVVSFILWLLFRGYYYQSFSKEKIDTLFKPITSKYGIKIVYKIGDDFFSPLENPPFPAGPPRNSNVKPIRHRVLIEYSNILQKAFDKYPVAVIKKHLNAIYFASEIDANGYKFGGSYDPFRQIMYLVDNGEIKDDEAMGAFHHEFSSLLIRYYSFFVNRWTDYNPKNFNYLYGTNADARKMYNSTSLVGTNDDYEKGFMNSYGQTCFGNDFSEYSAMIFTYPEKFKKIMSQYPRVRSKFKVWLEFYRKIDPIFTKEYLLGEISSKPNEKHSRNLRDIDK